MYRQASRPILRNTCAFCQQRPHSHVAVSFSPHGKTSASSSIPYGEPSQASSAYLPSKDDTFRPPKAATEAPENLTARQKRILDRIIRVDQAGELGANWIYMGQLAVLKRTSDKRVVDLVQKMWDGETKHIAAFDKIISQYGVRPTLFYPLWKAAGFALGAGTAAMGERAAMACTEAVETVIGEHYAAQMKDLEKMPKSEQIDLLKQVIKEFRDDELEHLDTAVENDSQLAPGHALLSALIGIGCRAAIALLFYPHREWMAPTAAELYASGLNAFRVASYDTACELFSSAIELSAKAQYYDARSQCHERLGSVQDALADIRQALKLDPTAVRCYLRASKLWENVGKPEKALTLLKIGLGHVKTPDRLRERIAELEGVIAQKERKRTLMPLATLPVEIFTSIMMMVIEDEWQADRPSASLSFPVIASHVCRQWRHIILTTPVLWQRISVSTVRTTSQKKTRAEQHRFTSCIERAAGKATHVFLRLSVLDDLSTSELLALQSVNAQESIRYVSVSMFCRDEAEQRQTCSLAARQIPAGARQFVRDIGPRLASLIVKWSLCSRESLLNDLLQDPWHTYSNLETFQVLAPPSERQRNDRLDPNFVSRWFTPELVDELFASLKHEQNVVVSRLTRLCLEPSYHPSFLPDSVVSFPSLKELVLRVSGTFRFLLQTQSVGALELVEIEDHAPWPPEQAVRVLDNVVEWSALKKFVFGAHRPVSEALVKHMVSQQVDLRSLEHLTAEFSISSSDFFELLASTNAPRLAHLDLSRSTLGGFSGKRPVGSSSVLLGSMPALRSLNLSSCAWVDDALVGSLVTQTPSLTSLDLSNNPAISVGPVVHFVKSREDLPNNDDESIRGRDESRRYSLLTSLNLLHCGQLEEAGVRWLRNNIRPGGFQFQFYDPAEERRGFRVSSSRMP